MSHLNLRYSVNTGSPWESKMGYCRAVRIGHVVEISGTVALIDDEEVLSHDVYSQTVNIIQRASDALVELGLELKDVIRTRIYTTDISLFDEIARAHHHFFKDIMPVTSIVEVSALIAKEYLVEIEFSALIER